MNITSDRDLKMSEILQPIKEGILDDHDEADMEPEDRNHLRLLMNSHLSNLNTFSDELIDGLHEVITDKESPFASGLTALLSGGENSSSVHEHLKFRPLITGDHDLGDVRMILRPLHEYPQLPQIDNYASCDPSITEQVAALVIVTERLYSLRNEARYTGEDVSWLPLNHIRGGVLLSGEALILLTLDRPQDAERIAEIIITRRTTEADFILSILTASAPAVSDGVI